MNLTSFVDGSSLAEDGGHDDALLHLRELLSDAVARSGREGDVGVGVPRRSRLGREPLGVKPGVS